MLVSTTHLESPLFAHTLHQPGTGQPEVPYCTRRASPFSQPPSDAVPIVVTVANHNLRGESLLVSPLPSLRSRSDGRMTETSIKGTIGNVRTVAVTRDSHTAQQQKGHKKDTGRIDYKAAAYQMRRSLCGCRSIGA